MQFVSRAQWGARRPKSRVAGTLSDPSTVHWNGPKMPVVGHERCASLVRGIQNFHMDGRGWSDIAYNFLTCVHGYVFEGRGLNVWNGANGTNHGNRSSHAVMVMVGTGNVFTVEARRAIIDAVDHVAARTRAPAAPVKGHRDHKSTECPGDEIYAWVHAGLPVGPAPKPIPPKAKDNDMIPEIIKALYNLARRKSEAEYYDVVTKDPQGWLHWNVACFKSADPLGTINGLMTPGLEKETGRKLPRV